MTDGVLDIGPGLAAVSTPVLKPLVDISKGQPVDEVVKELEELIAKARAGEVRSVAYVTINRDGTSSAVHAGTSQWLHLVGALRRLEHRILMRDEE